MCTMTWGALACYAVDDEVSTDTLVGPYVLAARRAILRLHTQEWRPPPAERTIAVGFSRYCSPRHPTRFEPSFLESHHIL